jgi:hypothetical protein
MIPVNWIVSYPRSGNTFARALIANYFSGLDYPLTLDEIVQSTHGEHDENIWLDLTGKPPSERKLDEEWRARPAYFARLRGMTNPHLPMIKSHSVAGPILDRPAFEFMAGDRIVHLVRHPCDVAISCSYFYNIDLTEAIRRILMPGLYIHGLPEIGFEVIGSWAQHTRSWMELIDVPIHRVRYFELVAKPVEVLMSIVAFLGAAPDPSRAEIAVNFCDFNRMRSEEELNGFAESSRSSSNPFFRKGQPGEWIETLTVDQARQILGNDPELIDQLKFANISIFENAGTSFSPTQYHGPELSVPSQLTQMPGSLGGYFNQTLNVAY